jgi:hypothetical protein
LAATVPTAGVFSQTVLNTPQLFNSTYWYYTPLVSQLNNLGSIGFSKSQVIDQNSADAPDLANNTKLSWHITHVNTGGYRLGSQVNINNSTAHIKQVWTWTPSSAKTSGFYFSDSYTANQSHFLSDPDGQLRATVDYIKQKFGSLIKR